MDAHKAGISDIFTSMTLIEVPFFQRAYVWKEDLWERFLEDMEYVTQTNKTHFFGSIILKDAGKVSAEIAKLHAESEFEKYRIIQDQLYMSDYDKYMLELETAVKESK